MANHLEQNNAATTDLESNTWQLNALTEALGDLTLMVSDSLSIGRGNDNDVVLGSKSVSRNHAQLSVLNGKLHVKDLESSNGTFINDQRIEGSDARLLNVNDTVSFASFAFQVAMPVEDTIPMNASSAPVTEATADAQASDSSKTKAATAAVAPSSIKDSPAVDSPAAVTADAVTTSEAAAKNTSKPAAPTSGASKSTLIEETAENTETIDSQDTINATDEPVVEEIMVKEVMASTVDENTSPAAAVVEPILLKNTVPLEEEQETMMSNDKSDKTLKAEPLETKPDEPKTDEPLMKKTAAHQESVVTPEHDKTTTTELQEEADPEVLRAKQAATAQFSGTANLGQGRDLGTEGNNAMDQAIDNPANPGQTERKPSGGWFIWVFIAILIIGVALWLFNMGGV